MSMGWECRPRHIHKFIISSHQLNVIFIAAIYTVLIFLFVGPDCSCSVTDAPILVSQYFSCFFFS